MKKIFQKKKIAFLIFTATIFVLPSFVFAKSVGETQSFYIEPEYDFFQRDSVSATLQHIGTKGYFYIDDEWWNQLTSQEKQEALDNIISLSEEFDQKIYPVLTSIYGPEWRPGIDKDYRITILLHQMKEQVGGYTRNIDEYYKIQAPHSNQREMVYLNVDYLNSPLIKSYLAHEFTHLIIFNQKERKYGVEEKIWLNEAIADYSPAILGYEDKIPSPLENRIKYFVSSPSDSLLQWQNQLADYGIMSIFTHYLVDHFGLEILKDAVHTSKTGIEAINYALKKNGFDDELSEIFTEWSIAVFLNDCEIGERYCFKDKNLVNLKITPSLIYLPSTQKTNFQLVYNIWDWSARWFKIIGGNKGLKIKVFAPNNVNFHLPYIIFKNGTQTEVHFLEFKNGVGEIELPKFAQENTSLVLIPSITQSSLAIKKYSFTIQITSLSTTQEMSIEEMKAKILEIQKKILEIKKLLAQLQRATCTKITKNLYYGLRNDPQVRCLQEFLRSQGPEIYPEGLVTGNFLDLTYRAVIRFQEKYKEEILEPLGLHHGTGFVGPMTRKKINQLLSNQYSSENESRSLSWRKRNTTLSNYKRNSKTSFAS